MPADFLISVKDFRREELLLEPRQNILKTDHEERSVRALRLLEARL